MTTKAQSSAGTVLSISAAAPATYDAAGFAAVSYTAVAEVTDMGSFGKVFSLIAHNPVGDRKKYKLKGDYDNGKLALKLAKTTLANADAGQTMLLAASNSDADYTFSFRFQDGSHAYMTGKVMSFTTMISTVNTILGADVQVEVTSDIVETAL